MVFMIEVDKVMWYSPAGIVKRILDGGTFPRENIYNVISNAKRQEIIKFCSKEKKTIMQIKEHIGLSYNPTWKHVQQLIDKGLVIPEAGIDKRGAVMYIKTINPDGTLHGKKIK